MEKETPSLQKISGMKDTLYQNCKAVRSSNFLFRIKQYLCRSDIRVRIPGKTEHDLVNFVLYQNFSLIQVFHHSNTMNVSISFNADVSANLAYQTKHYELKEVST